MENEITKIVRGALILMMVENINANLFMLKEETLQEVDVYVAPNKEELSIMWHLKLCHMLDKCLKILSEQKLLLGLKSIKLLFSEHCVISKQHELKL